jgi:hypothetical protein
MESKAAAIVHLFQRVATRRIIYKEARIVARFVPALPVSRRIG